MRSINQVLMVTVSLIFILLGLIAVAESSSLRTPLALPMDVAESRDFATLVLGDPWDMSEFSDVSMYLNQSGQADLVQNISVQGGVFSAQSTNNADAWIFPLFPGYLGGMLIGKIGQNYAIDSSEYQCLYMAMKAEAVVDAGQPGSYQIFWFEDETLDLGTFGVSPGQPLYFPEEPGGVPPSPYWKLYKYDLTTSPVVGTTAWTDRSEWRGLRIDPTNQANLDFEIDWIRLSDCSSTTETITWTPHAGTYAIWLQSNTTGHNIRLTTASISGSSGTFDLDTKGLAPGTYTIRLGGQNTCCSGPVPDPDTLVVNQAPIAQFLRPSPYSGVDYASQVGNPWDMDSTTDTPVISCASSSITDGILSLQTLTSAQQPLECQTGGISDPKIQLNAPSAANSNDFRYLSFRMNTDGAWQNVPEGMIVRWVWSIQHSNGLPGHFCHLVSQDIPFDVGWHTYSIDLHDPFNGLVEEHTEGCPGGTLTWQNTSPVLQMRFDPNENITGSTMNQDIDWIRLTQMDREVKGTPFPIEYLLNKDSTELSSITFYYTSDPQNNPTQNLALDYSPSPGPTPSGPYFVYQPLVYRDYQERDLPKGLIFLWDTSSVNPGIYYICAVVQDSYNQGTYCSQAPVEIVNP